MDLVAFLKARLDEDEAAAKDERIWFGPYPETIGEFEGHLVIQQERVLREVEAKRAILGAYAFQSRYDDSIARVLAHTLREVLRVLAAVYSSHPDYDPEWAAGVTQKS